MESRLIALETRYTHLERQVEELSQVVFEQQKTIDRLTKEVSIARDRMAGVEGGPVDPPPHY
jgi:uncharacterized coiled-coil protein SlyX